MMVSEGGQFQVSSSQDDVLKTLLEGLNKEDDSKSSFSTSEKKQESHASSLSDCSTIIKDMLAPALKSSTQWNVNSYGQNTSNTTLLESSVYG